MSPVRWEEIGAKVECSGLRDVLRSRSRQSSKRFDEADRPDMEVDNFETPQDLPRIVAAA